MVGIVVAVMMVLTIGSGALFAAQVPTMRESRPRPPAEEQESSSRAQGGESIRDQYNTTVPGLVVAVQEVKVEAKETRTLVNEQRVDIRLARADIDRILSYLTYLAGILSALVIGVVLQIYQSHQNGRILRERGDTSRG